MVVSRPGIARTLICACAMATLLTACGGVTAEERELEDAREAWAEQHLETYRLEYTSTFGFAAGRETVVEVTGGSGVVVEWDGQVGRTPTGDVPLTVDDFHDLIASIIDSSPDELRVEYDLRGVPRNMHVNPLLDADDDSYSYTRISIEPLT